LKKKLRDHYFDTAEVIEAESQEELNTLIEHDFQDALKNGRSSGNGAYLRKGITSRVMVVSRSKVSSWSDARVSPGNYGWFFVSSLLSFGRRWIPSGDVVSHSSQRAVTTEPSNFALGGVVSSIWVLSGLCFLQHGPYVRIVPCSVLGEAGSQLAAATAAIALPV
jgi:hypothetical protein